MDFEVYHKYPPGDPTLVEKIVCHLKAQGIFDNFRKECLSDVDTKPAYQNLRQRVDGSVAGYLAGHKWKPDLNKNQLRESLRKYIQNGGFLEVGVERIVDQVVNPKIGQVFLPRVRDVVFEGLGLKEESDNNETTSDRPASSSCMPSSSSAAATSSTHTSASICNQTEGSKEKANLEKEVVPSTASETKKEDSESAQVGHSEEFVDSDMELDPESQSEETVIKLETQNETRSNDSSDTRISGISDLTSVKSNASNGDDNFDKSDSDEEKEDTDNINKSMTSINEDDESSQDKSEVFSNVIHENTFSNSSFPPEFNTQVENVEIENDQIGTSVVECVTTENNEGDTDGRDTPNPIPQSNFDSDSNGMYEHEHESTALENDHNNSDKEFDEDVDENVCEEISRGLNSDHKEECHHDESQSETDLERFDSTSNEMRFSENTIYFDSGNLEQSSEDENHEIHSLKKQEETEKERKHRKDQERKHHSRHKHSKDHHSNSSSGGSRDDRNHSRSKDKHRHNRDDDSHSTDADGKSRKTDDHSDSKHRRSKDHRGEEKARTSKEETSRSDNGKKNKYVEKVTSSHKDRSSSRHYENVDEENAFNEDEESKSECDEKNIHEETIKYSHEEKLSRSRDRKKAKKDKTRYYDYEDTTSDHEEATRRESDDKTKYRENPDCSKKETPTKGHKKVSKDHEQDEITSDYELATKSKTKVKNKNQEKVKYSHKDENTHSSKYAPKAETHDLEYEEATTFDHKESRKNESNEGKSYKDEAELSHEEMPTRRRNRKKAFKEDYEYGEITSDYEEASRSESEEKYKYQEKLKSDEKSSTHSRDRKKASKQETHNYEETQFDTEETKKSKSGEKTIARSKDRKRSTREELNKNEESEFDLKEQSNDEFEVENEYQEVEKSKRERSSCSRRHKDKTIERENDDEYGKTTSDGEETGKSESEEKNRNQGKVKKEKHGRSRDYETSHIDEQDKEIIDEEETNKANSDEKKKYRDSKHDRKEKHSRSQDKKHESNVKAQDDEYENIMFGQQEANESDDVENENQEVESSQKASHSRSRDHKHVSKEKSHDGDHKRKKEEQTRSEKKHDSNSKKEHSSIKDDVKKDRSHKTGSREHRSSHKSSRDKHATKESENYDKEKENNDDKSKKDKSKKSRDSCKPVDKSREERRSTDGDNSGTGREEGRSVGGSASSRYTRSQKTKTKESRSGGKGSHSSTSDAAVPQDSQHYEECVEAETVLQYSFTPNDDGGHPAVYTVHVDNDDNSTSAGEETSAIVCEENEVNTKDDDGDKADDAATKEEENKKQDFNLHTTEVLDNIITLEFGVSQNSNNELEIPSFNSPINTRENSENKENCDENLKLNYQTFDTDVMSNNSDFQLDGETKILQVNEEIDLDKPNAEILVSSQNSETQNSRDDRVEFRKKRFAENFAELRKIMRERRRNKRIQKKCLSVGNTAANDDHSSMTDQSMNNQALVEENRLGESSTSVECVEEVVVKEPDESSFKNSTDETIPLPLPVVETNSFSYKRPKVASNIFEVRKIIKARKRLRRIEEKKRFSLPHFNSNKLSVEGVTKTQIEAFKQNNDKFRGNYSTEKSRSCKKMRDTEKPKLAKHSKRDSKGRFIRNEPKCEESNTENLITLKIKSQERVGSETKDFECKSTLSYQDINQLASKCLVVKLKKLDDINFKKDSVAVTNSVESLITDNTDDQPESKLPFQSNENGCESVAEAKTSAKGIIEEKSLNVDARQVEEVDLLICESEVVDNNCVPLEGSTGEKYQLSPHRQSESTSEAPVLDEVDERFTEENPISNSTEVENSCETGPIVLEDDEIGSHSCEIPKPVANAPEIGGTTERITALNDPTTQQSSDKLQSIEVQNSNASEISEEEIETNSGEKMQSIEVQSLNASQVLRGKMGKDSRDELRSIEVQNSNASETMEEEETETNSSEKLPSIEVQNSNALEILEEELESNSNEKLQSIEDQSSNAPETVEEEIESNSSEELQSIKGRSSNASEIVKEEKENNSSEKFLSIEVQNSNVSEIVEEEKGSNSSEKLLLIVNQSSNAPETMEEEKESNSSKELQSIEVENSNASEIVEEEKESNSNEILKSTEDQNSNAPETMEEEIESNSSEELQSIEGQSSNASEILREEMVNDSSEKFQSVELVPNAQNYNSLEPTVSDNLQPLTTFEVGVSSPMRGFDTNEITEKARMKLEKFKTVLNACEKEYNVLKDMEKTEFVTSDFELDKKFDSYLEKECGFQVLRKDCILLPSLNDENYFFDKESGWYYLKNRLINRSQICKKNMNAKGTSVKKSKVVKSFESSSEKRSVGGKLLSQESRKSPVKLRISIRNPNSSVIETEEINVPYTSDVESLTDGSTGRISIDSRRISEDVSSESELNNCGDRVRASTPLQDNSTAESERVQPLVHQVPLLETPSKSTKKKRAHSRRNKSLNYSNKKSSHQEFKIKSCPEAENNNLPSGEGRAQLSPFKITFSRSNSSLPKIIAPQSPSSQSNNFSMDAAVPSESESRLVVGKRHASKTDDGSCSPKKKFHSDTDFIRVDQAIEAVTDSLNNSFEEEVDIRHDDSIESSMIGEALKNLIAESGLATTTQTPPSYQETKKPAKITKHNRNQKLSIESESTDNPPKKLRNSERLSAGVRLPKRFEDADLCFDFGNRRKRKQDESAIDSSVDNEPPRKRRLSNVVTSTRRSSR